jgi:hypothetical protein
MEKQSSGLSQHRQNHRVNLRLPVEGRPNSLLAVSALLSSRLPVKSWHMRKVPFNLVVAAIRERMPRLSGAHLLATG